MKETENFYLKQPEPNKSCLLALRKIILKLDNQISESIKREMPCFSYKNRIFCFISLTKEKQTPYILVVEGRHIFHPLLESGDRKRMKILNINPNEDIPIYTITEVLQEALNLYKKGIIKAR